MSKAEQRKRVCEACGQEFVMHRPSGKANRGEVKEGRFCSRKCYSVWRLSQPKAPKEPKPRKVYTKACPVCGRLFTSRYPRARCSRECDLEYGRLKEFKANSAKKKMIKRICKECGKEFIPKYGDKRRSFCSEFCCHKYTVKAKYKDARKRARALGVYYEYVNPLKVFKRDGWCCQLCGKKLKPKHRGTYRDDAPELDHIIPWAQGGEHSYRNTQLACRKCNAEKGAQSIGQMLLFG